MKLIAYSVNMLILLTILPFISCGNNRDNADKQNTNIEKQTDVTKPGNNNNPDTEKVGQTDYKLQPFEVIFKPTGAEFKDIFGDKYRSRVPEISEIPIAEKLLKECLDREKSGTVNHFLNRSVDEYFRQFVGASDSAGNKIIWVNCFTGPEKQNDIWKNELIIAKGGGNSFFNLMVNISNNAYYDLNVNGNK